MFTSTEAFLGPLEQWIRAVRADDFVTARKHAEHLIKAGELLAIHPQFMRCFKAHDGVCEPKEALFHLCQFLVCATDGRAAVLKQWLEDNKPNTV
jgi:hypothetical protein